MDIEWFAGLALFVFSGVFGYAWCARKIVETNDVDLSGLKEQDVKTFKKIAEEIHMERENIVKIGEKLARYEEFFDKTSSSSDFIINEKVAKKASESKKRK